MYANNFFDEYNGNRKFKLPFMLITNTIYIIFLLLYFILFFVIFIIRDIIRNKNMILSGMNPMDVVADIVSYLLFAIILYLFDFLTGIFPRFESWNHDAYKKISYSIKKMITCVIGIFSLMFVLNYYTLHGNYLKDNFALFKNISPTFFGCPGKFEDHRHTYHDYENLLDTDYTKMKSSSFAQCREEDVGNNFFLIFLFYFIINFFIELFKNSFNCFRKNKENFNPVKSIINSLFMYYIPYSSNHSL